LLSTEAARAAVRCSFERAAVRCSFERAGWKRITAASIPGNEASRRVLERVGFEYEKDIDYYAKTGDTTIMIDSPMIPAFALRQERFASGDAPYHAVDFIGGGAFMMKKLSQSPGTWKCLGVTLTSLALAVTMVALAPIGGASAASPSGERVNGQSTLEPVFDDVRGAVAYISTPA
jgi:hypothetical protein